METRTDEVLFTDMGACSPASAISREQKPGSWFAVDYQTEDGVAGTTVYAEPEHPAPALTLRLGLEGWHAIHIGINYTRTELSSGWDESPAAMLRVRLSGDEAFTRIGAEFLFKGAPGNYPNKMGRLAETWNSIYEVHWKSADLTGQDLLFAQPIPGSLGSQVITAVAWVRAVKLSASAIDATRRDVPRAATRRLAACFCLGNFTGSTGGTPVYRCESADYLRELLEPFRDSDFDLFLAECIRGDMCAYPTRIGRVGEEGERWKQSWVDPMAVVVPHAQKLGMKAFVSMRMVGCTYPLKRSPMQKNLYYYRNQRFAIRDERGTVTSNLSLAYPEIRTHWIELLREALRYGADGVHLCLNRNQPFALYEEPARQSFRTKYGVDPVALDFDDPRWLGHRASFVTQYFREIRAMLDLEGARMGKRLGFAVTFYHKPSPEHFAMDPATWAREGLVDYLMPHAVTLTDPDAAETVRALKRFSLGTSVRLYPDIFPRTPSGFAYADKARELYDAGADGFSFWSAEMRTTRASEWAVVKRLGHREELGRYRDQADALWRRVPLYSLDGVALKYSHTDG